MPKREDNRKWIAFLAKNYTASELAETLVRVCSKHCISEMCALDEERRYRLPARIVRLENRLTGLRARHDKLKPVWSEKRHKLSHQIIHLEVRLESYHRELNRTPTTTTGGE